MTTVVFLDRDGVVNADIGYLWRREDLIWIPGAPETIRLFNERGWPVVVITNQSGVARGYYREEDVQDLHAWMNVELRQSGAHIDAFYYCPHHPRGNVPEYILECNCRKPRPGLLLQAMKEWRADPATSFLIGDKDSDLEAAQAAGIKGYLFTHGNLADYVRRNVPTAIES